MIKRLLYGISVIIPLMMVYAVLLEPVMIFIPELGIEWNYRLTAFLCIFLTVVWLCCSPLREECCDGGLMELLFNLVPVELMAMVIFAQWHFWAAVLLSALFVLAEAAILWGICKDARRHIYSDERHWQYHRIFQRCSLLAAVIITAVPCCLSLFVYDLQSPTYRAAKGAVPVVSSEVMAMDGEETDAYEAYRNLFQCFAEENWKEYDIDKKITVMQELADFEAEQLGIPKIPLLSKKLGTYTLGEYHDETKEMWIDVQQLTESSAEKCITILCHEIYHAAQHYLVTNMDWDQEVLQSAYFEELRQWKDNRENYKTAGADGYEAYVSQPLEVSANAYAKSETAKILSYMNREN